LPGFKQEVSVANRNVPGMSTVVTDPASPDEVISRLHAIHGAIAELADVASAAFDDRCLDARLEAALAAQAAVDELVARIAGEVDVAGVAVRAGCPSTRAWLTARHRLSRGEAKRLLGRARAMSPRVEATREAWARGAISGDQAEVIATALNTVDAAIPAQRIEAAECDLLSYARHLPLADLRRVANRLVEVVDPDAADQVLCDRLEAQEKVAMQQAVFRLTKGVDGVARLGGKIPNVHADMLMANLEALASPRRDHLHADGTGTGQPEAVADTQFDSLPVDADSGTLTTYGQRLGRAFCEWIERLPADGSPPGSAVNATVVVSVDETRLREAVGTATLSTGGEVSIGEVRRLACGAGILPLVLGGDSIPLDLGRAPASLHAAAEAGIGAA
jgi:hypothetical protein